MGTRNRLGRIRRRTIVRQILSEWPVCRNLHGEISAHAGRLHVCLDGACGLYRLLALRAEQASIPKHGFVQCRRDVTEFGMGGVYQDIAFDPRHDARHDQGDALPL